MGNIRDEIRDINEALDAKRHEEAYPDMPVRYVNAYSITRSYGGPEEGGWWYDEGEPLGSIPVKTVEQEDAARKLLQETVGWEPDRRNRIGRYSVNGDADFVICVEDEMATAYPEERPHYE